MKDNSSYPKFMGARWIQVSNSLRLRVPFLPGCTTGNKHNRVKTNPKLNKLSEDLTSIHVKLGF